MFVFVVLCSAGTADDALTSQDTFAKMQSKQKAIASSRSILIVGGGPVGVELAGTN